MVGRWALAKPWIFREFEEGRDVEPGPEERLAVLRRYVEICREHFGDDDRGRQRIRRFFTFHQDYFRRFRRGAGPDAVNEDDPRGWGRPPEGELEEWLCRADVAASRALAHWLVDGGPAEPPPPVEEGAERAVKVDVLG